VTQLTPFRGAFPVNEVWELRPECRVVGSLGLSSRYCIVVRCCLMSVSSTTSTVLQFLCRRPLTHLLFPHTSTARRPHAQTTTRRSRNDEVSATSTCYHVASPTPCAGSPTSTYFRRVTWLSDRFRSVTSSCWTTTGFRRSGTCCGGWNSTRCHACTWPGVDCGWTPSASCCWLACRCVHWFCRIRRYIICLTVSLTCQHSRCSLTCRRSNCTLGLC